MFRALSREKSESGLGSSNLPINEEAKDAELAKRSTKKYMTINSNIGSGFLDDSDSVREEKKSQFYVSQNYIKSKKMIENVSLAASKIKKRSVCAELVFQDFVKNLD
jgi:hypothetical protein